MIAYSPGYPTDNNRQPNGKERSREKQRSLWHGSWDKEALHLGKYNLYIKHNIIINLTPPLVNNTLCYNFSLPLSHTCVSIEKAPNSGSTNEIDISSEPSPPSVILHSTNVPADPSLWDGGFVATSLFGMNEFLQSNVCNIACSLQHMAFFIKQRNLQDYNSNNISQLEFFGKAA